MGGINDPRHRSVSRTCRFLLPLVLLVGCTDGGSGANPEPSDMADDGPEPSDMVDGAPEPSGMADDAAAAIIAVFTFADPESQFALHDHRSDPAVVAAAGDALSRGAVGDELWAATYVWVNEGDDPEPLLALIDDEDATIRVMAGTGLIARGRAEGFAPLIEALTDETVLVGHEPPAPAWYMATTSLMRFTGRGDLGPPLDADPSRRLSAQQRWLTWLLDNEDSVSFDPEELLWHAG